MNETVSGMAALLPFWILIGGALWIASTGIIGRDVHSAASQRWTDRDPGWTDRDPAAPVGVDRSDALRR